MERRRILRDIINQLVIRKLLLRNYHRDSKKFKVVGRTVLFYSLKKWPMTIKSEIIQILWKNKFKNTIEAILIAKKITRNI